MRYEVVIRDRDGERIVAETRREQGAINIRNERVDSEYAVRRKHNEDGFGRVVQGADEDDPNAVSVVYFDEHVEIVTTFTYRRKVR